MPCYSTHSKYLPAQKPHRWQGRDDMEPSNLLDYSWFIPWQPLQKCSFLHHIVWAKTAMRRPRCTACTYCMLYVFRKEAYNKILAWIHQCHMIRGTAGTKKRPWRHSHHVMSLFAWSLWNHNIHCYEIIIMHDRDVGVPCHCIVFQSIHQGFPQFRNEIIFIWQHDSNFKPGLVHCFPLHPLTTPGISLTRPVWEHLLCVSARARVHVLVWLHIMV